MTSGGAMLLLYQIKSMKPEKSYRPNVGLIVFNRKGEVLVGERLGVPDSWQFPQGGIDD